MNFKCPKNEIRKAHTLRTHVQRLSSTYGAIMMPFITHANSKLMAVTAIKPIPNLVMFITISAPKKKTTTMLIFNRRCRFDGTNLIPTRIEINKSKKIRIDIVALEILVSSDKCNTSFYYTVISYYIIAYKMANVKH